METSTKPNSIIFAEVMQTDANDSYCQSNANEVWPNT